MPVVRLSSPLLLALPAWLALLFYLPTLSFGYVWDDTYFLRDLPYLRDSSLWWQAIQQPLFVSHNYFRPLPLLMFVAEAKLGGPGAFAFHLGNVLLHAANTLLMTVLARGMLPADRRGAWLAACAALLFALHPVLVENVSWISDRFDLLMASFVLLALCVEQRMATGLARNLVLAACLLGALLSKETGIVLLALLPLWQLFLHMAAGGKMSAAMQVWLAPPQRKLYCMLLLAVVGYLLLRYGALGFLYRGDSQMVSGGLLAHLLLVGKTMGCYFSLLVFPFGQLSPVHPTSTPIATDDLWAWAGGVASMGLLLWIGRGLYRARANAVLALMALVALAPVANLLPLTIGDNIAHDRFLILPVAFVALLVVRVLYPLAGRLPQVLLAIWLAATAVCVILAVPRWESNLTLWEWAYAKHPRSQIAGANYLLALLDAQRNADALILGRELMGFEQPPALVATLHHSLALAYARTDDLAAAEREIKLRLDEPRRDDAVGRYGVSEALNLLAHIQMQQGRLDAAEANLREAMRLTPYLPRPHFNLALLHYRQGKLDQGDAELALCLQYAAPEQRALFSRQAGLARDEASAR